MKPIHMTVAALVGSLCIGCVDQGATFNGELEVEAQPLGECDPLDPCCGSPDPCCGSDDPCCGSEDPYCDEDPAVPPGSNGTPYASLQFLPGFFALDVPLGSGLPDANGVYALHPTITSWLSGELDFGNRYFKAKLVRKLVQYFSHVPIAIPANGAPVDDSYYLPAETIHGQALMRHDLAAASLGTQRLKDFVEDIVVLSVNNNFQQGTTPVMFVSDMVGSDGQTLLNVNANGRWPTLMPENIASYTVDPMNSSFYLVDGYNYVNDAQFEYFDPVSGTTKRMVLEYALTGGHQDYYYAAMSDFVWNALQQGVELNDGQNVIPPHLNVPSSADEAVACRFCSGNLEECRMDAMRPIGDGIAMMKVKVQPTADDPYAVSGVHRYDAGASKHQPWPRVAVFVPEDAIPTLYNCDFTGSGSSE